MPSGPFTKDVLTKLAEFNTINSPLYNSAATYTFEPNTTGSVSPEVTALLTSFDATNTGTFYPELNKIKLLTIDANRFSPNTVIYKYTFTSGGGKTDYFKSILSNLQYLFPDMFIYYNKDSFVQSLTYDSIKFIPATDIYTNNVTITNTIFISQTALQIIGQLIFSYTGTVAPTSTQIPFIEVPPYVTFTPGTVINSGTVTVTVNVLVDYAYNSSNYGLSFANVIAFYQTNATNLSITTLTNISLSNAGSQFAGLTTLSITPGQNPIIRSVSSLASCFSGCTDFNSNITGWNTTTTNVTNMDSCFLNCTNFNNGYDPGVGVNNTLGWTLSANITTLESCFSGCTSFNSIPHGIPWLISNTTNVVTTIAKCFYNCTKFNNGLNPGVATNNVLWSGARSITDMTSCFEGCQSFNSSVASWNVKSIKQLDSCFKGCAMFNSELSWAASLGFPISMISCFEGCTVFNNGTLGNILSFNTSQVTSLNSCFNGCTNFNTDIGAWNTSQVTTLNSCFNGCTVFNKDIGAWNTIQVTTLNSCFKGCTVFNQNIGAWITSQVTDITSVFQNAIKFNNGGILMTGWSFTGTPTSTDWHLNSALTYENASTALKVLYPPPP